MKTCTIDGCNQAHRARGLCSTHYNRTLGDARHKPKPKICSGCGTAYLKQMSGRTYATNYCSELCRQWVQFGVWSCKLPASHQAMPQRPAATIKPPSRTYNCDWCGTACTSTRSRAKYCSRWCLQRYAKVKRRALEAHAPGMYTWADVTRLWIAFDRCCAYCSTPTPLADIQAEHVYPLSRGGANNTTNLLPSCGPCNSDKRDLLLDQWAQDRERRHLPAVTTTWHTGDGRYKHLNYRTNLRLSA